MIWMGCYTRRVLILVFIIIIIIIIILQGVVCRRRPSRRGPPGGRGGPRPDTTDVVSRGRRLHIEHAPLLEDTVKGTYELNTPYSTSHAPPTGRLSHSLL